MDSGTLTTITSRVKSAVFCVGAAIRLSGTRKTLRVFSEHALNTLNTTRTEISRRRKDLLQLVAFCAVIHGIDMIYAPAAWIFGGLLIFAAMEIR